MTFNNFMLVFCFILFCFVLFCFLGWTECCNVSITEWPYSDCQVFNRGKGGTGCTTNGMLCMTMIIISILLSVQMMYFITRLVCFWFCFCFVLFSYFMVFISMFIHLRVFATFYLFLCYVKEYLCINSMKLVTNAWTM